MRLRTTRTFAAIGIAATAIGIGALPASASVTSRHPVRASHAARGLTAQKLRCTFEVDRRVFTLGLARVRVAQVRHLTDAQRAAEVATIDAVSHSLGTVNRPAIGQATTKAALDAACQAVYLDNRVYAVVIPQLFLTVRADQLGELGDTLSANIATAKAAGKDTTAVAAVASVTVGQYNADHAAVNAVLEQSTSDLEAARTLGAQASHDLAAL